MHKFLLTVLLLTGLTACQTTGTNTGDVGYKQGDILEGNFRFGFGELVSPLPEGQWEVAATHTKRNSANEVNLYLLLVQEKDGIIANTIEVSTNDQPTSGGFKATKSCSRKGVHFLKTLDNFGGGKQDCMWLNHSRGEIRSTNWYGRYWKTAVKYTADKGYQWPNVVLISGHTFAKENQYFAYTLAVNPEIYGFEKPVNHEWKTSEWHPNNTAKDKAKTSFVEKLKSLTVSYHEKVKAGWEGRLITGEVESFSNNELQLSKTQ
ncbi:hypothetical protein [Kiloniella sp.]|uniref:hypothetical protein n=1 Tax=Kiloniella sp. TaxID=1938587 RepID=UPI003B01AD90